MNGILALSTPTIIDIVALCIIALFVIMGALKGFIGTVISAFGTIASILLAILLSTTVTKWLESSFGFITAISDEISGVLTNIFGETFMNTPLSEANSETLAESGVTGWIIAIILQIQAEGTIDPETTLNKIISPVFGYYIGVIVSCIVLFIIIKLLFKIIEKIAKKAHNIKAIKWVDSILGLALGLLRALITIDIIIMTIQVIPLPTLQSLSAQIDAAPVAHFIDSINIISTILNSVIGTSNISEIITKMISGA